MNCASFDTSRTVRRERGQATAVPDATAQQPYPRRWAMLPVALIAMFMAGFDI
jgi:hypothetical protein